MLNFTAMAVAAVVGLAADGAAVAGPPPAATPVSAPAAKAKPDPMDQMVCRDVQQTGTLFGDRVCHSRREWTEMSKESRRLLEDVQQRGQMVRLPGS